MQKKHEKGLALPDLEKPVRGAYGAGGWSETDCSSVRR